MKKLILCPSCGGDKKIRPEDVNFVKSLRITPDSVETLRAHFDEYEKIENRRSLGKFYTKPEVASRVHDIILKYVDPSFILEPYAGSGSLVTPFIDYKGLMNDISREDIEVARMTFEGLSWRADNIDCISKYSAKELVDRWGLRDVWSSRSLIFTNPPFGSSRSKNSPAHQDHEIQGMKISGPLTEQYGKQDLVLPAIGQLMEITKELGQGYLAFFCPLGIFCGKRTYNKMLKQLLSQFTFCEGFILSGSDFNEVNKDKPIAFTVWKFGGSTRHLDLRFQYGEHETGLGEGFFLKDGWNSYAEDFDGTTLTVRCCGIMNDPYPAVYSLPDIRRVGTSRLPGVRVISENVKISMGVEGIPDEIIYSLWSTLVGYKGIVREPVTFNESYVHMPTDFTTKPTQMILVYTLLWNIVNELQRNYTKGLIGFAGIRRMLVFGTPEQSAAVRNLLDKYKDEPCLDNTVGNVLECLRTKEETGWDRVKELRKDLKTRLSVLLDEIGYWHHIVVKPVN